MMKRLFHSLTRVHRQSNLPNVAIFSAARSGSSWLMELIATQPGFKSVNEPLHPDHLIACKYADPPAELVWERLLPHDDREAFLRSYFQAIERNEIHIGEPRFLSEFYRWHSTRIVFKILRAQDLVQWFQHEFRWQIIFLIRHPIATNLSRKQFPRLDLFLRNKRFVADHLTQEQFEFSRRVQLHGTPLQKGVLDWCLQNTPVLKNIDGQNWLLMYYEDLICQPAIEIDRLTSFLNLEQPERIQQQLSKASISTVQSDVVTRNAFKSVGEKPTNDFLLTKWRSKVTTSDEEKAFQVLDAFEIDIYQRESNQPVRRLLSAKSDNHDIHGEAQKYR